MTGVAGLVLAAGSSSRMGTPKQLLPFFQSTLLDHVLAQTLASKLDTVVLVLGYKAKAIMKALKTDLRQPKLKVIQNKHHLRGISSSLITGVSAVEKEAQGVMVILGDMPHVTTSHMDLLLERYRQSGLPLAALTSGGRRSHPVIIGRPFFPALQRLRGDEGARELFLEHADQVCLVAPPETYDEMDVDTPDDYLALQREFGQ